MCIFSFKKYVPFFCELMEIEDINFTKKHWISTIDTWDDQKNLAHGLLLGCILQL